MEVILICNFSDFSTKWLKDVYKELDEFTRVKFTFDYITKRLIINLNNSKEEAIYIKQYPCKEIPSIIKKLNI